MDGEMSTAEIPMTMDTDVLVIGGGISGYSAALSAVEAGAEVILVEKTGASGGSAVLSGGSFAFAGTDMQRDAGIDDSPERLRADLFAVGQDRNDPALVDLYVSNQLDAYDWMKSLGVEFLAVSLSGAQSAPRSHTPDVHAMFAVLEQRAAEAPGFRVLHDAPARRLLTEAGNGCTSTVPSVCGALVDVEGQQRQVRTRRGVVLAAGGFSWSKALLGAFAPKSLLATPIANQGGDGDGLRFGMAVGAGLADMATAGPTFGMATSDSGKPIFLQVMYRGGIIVDPSGRRFVDESISYKKLGLACVDREYPVTYQIYDSRIQAQSIPGKMVNDFEAGLAGGYVRCADTIEELAKLIDVDPDTLRATVDRYNEGARQGVDPDFGRSSLGGGAGELVTLDAPPYYAIPSTLALAGTQGGITVGTSMQVRNVYGEPIPHLFASGETVGGFHGAGYMSGTMLGKGVIFGRVAGQSAATA